MINKEKLIEEILSKIANVDYMENGKYTIIKAIEEGIDTYDALNNNSVIDGIISESKANGVCDPRKHNWDYIKGKIRCDECGHPLHIADER